jgi:hypothetical protein
MRAGDKVTWRTRDATFGSRTRIDRPAVLLSLQTGRAGWSSIMILDGEQRRAVEARTNDLVPRDSEVPELDRPAKTP